MSDLFNLPESPLPPLEAARRRFEQLETEWRKSQQDRGRFNPDYRLIRQVLEAKEEVQRLEQEAMRK